MADTAKYELATMHLVVKRNRNQLTAILDALLYALMTAGIPYFLLNAYNFEASGIWFQLVIYLSVAAAIPVFVFNYLNFRVNSIELTDTEIIYNHTKYGKKIIDSVSYGNIVEVYSLQTPVLMVVSSNPFESFRTARYSAWKLAPILKALRQKTGSTTKYNLQFEVNTKRLFKMLAIVVSIVLSISVGLIWYVLATGPN